VTGVESCFFGSGIFKWLADGTLPGGLGNVIVGASEWSKQEEKKNDRGTAA
jgi:hypothetical protein